jgi:hypothetical protein
MINKHNYRGGGQAKVAESVYFTKKNMWIQ